MARVEVAEGVPTARPKRGPSLEIDLALSSAFDVPPAPRRPLLETPTRQSLEAVRLAEEETRLARGTATTGTPAKKTSEVSEVTSIATLDSIGRGEAPASGVSHPDADERVAQMRELYVQGETDAALALAASFDLDGAAEPEPFDVDPFGGLIPVEDEDTSLDATDPFEELHHATFDGELELESDLDASGLGARFGVGNVGPDDLPQDLPLIASTRPRSAPRRMAEPPASPSEPQPFAELEPVEDGLVALASLIPRMLVDPREIAQLPVDPRAAFILSHVDGIQSMEEILDVCPMPEDEAVELLEKLRVLGIISLG